MIGDAAAVKIDYDVPETFNMASVLVDRHVEEGRGDRVAYYCGDDVVTYAQLQRRVNKAGNVLRARGIDVGDRVAILMGDRIEFVETYLGAMKIGAVPVPLSTALKAEDEEFPGLAVPYYLEDSRAAAVVVDADLEPYLETARETVRSLRHVLVRGGEAANSLSYEMEMTEASDELDPEPTSKDDWSYWLYSSGTTGLPKAAVHLHGDMVFCIGNWIENVSQLTPADIIYSASKLFGSYGLSSGLYQPLLAGIAGVLTPQASSTQLAMETLRRYRPTIFFTVPTMYINLLHEAEAGEIELDTSSLRMCVSAGDALPAPIYERWRETLGLELLDGIGSTECGYIYIQNRPGQSRATSSGQLLPGYEVRILDDDGTPVPDGQVGELFLNARSAATYYWRKREKSRDAFRGPWYKTGDRYIRDSDGYFYYQGRADDMFKTSGGQWVSPIEVEAVLLRHTDVLEPAVVGCDDPSDEGKRKPKAFVVLRPGATPSQELKTALRKHTEEHLKPNYYKCPHWIEFVDELPKTAGGKIQRFNLRELG
jgi:benzoate-CoA ligase family protein